MPKQKLIPKPAGDSQPKLSKELVIHQALTRTAASIVQRLRRNTARDRAAKRI